MGITQAAPLKKEAGYPALDIFRLVAALLVVAIHTSPLWSVSELADFALSRVLARVAVPFFFMWTAVARAIRPMYSFTTPKSSPTASVWLRP